MKATIRSPYCKVLHVGPLPPPVGGMATVIDNLRIVLQDSVDVRVLNNVKTTPISRNLLQGINAQLHLLARLISLCCIWRPQIVHIHTCSWFTFWRSSVDVIIASLLRRRILLHIHGAEFKLFLESLSPLKAHLARFIFRSCSKVIVLGQTWKELLDDWCNPVFVEVIPNGVSIQPRRELLNEDIFLILCLANYERRKGQVDLLRAVKDLRSTRPILVALIGFEAEAGQQQELLTLAEQLGLTDNVIVQGPVMGTEKEAWWMRASCFCLPSYNEGMPISMLEAMARGVPVVVTRVGSIPEVVEDHLDAFLYDAGDVPSLTSCLQELINDPATAECIGGRGRDRQIKYHNFEQTVNQLLSIYTVV